MKHNISFKKKKFPSSHSAKSRITLCQWGNDIPHISGCSKKIKTTTSVFFYSILNTFWVRSPKINEEDTLNSWNASRKTKVDQEENDRLFQQPLSFRMWNAWGCCLYISCICRFAKNWVPQWHQIDVWVHNESLSVLLLKLRGHGLIVFGFSVVKIVLTS